MPCWFEEVVFERSAEALEEASLRMDFDEETRKHLGHYRDACGNIADGLEGVGRGERLGAAAAAQWGRMDSAFRTVGDRSTHEEKAMRGRIRVLEEELRQLRP